MNKQSKSARRTFFSSKLILSLMLAAASFNVSAQSVDKTDSRPPNNVIVKYLGTQDEMMLISVTYRNPEPSFNLAIYTSEGDLLFRDVYHVKTFDRKFRVPKEHGTVKFVLAGSDDKTSQSFQVSSGLTSAKDVVIKTP